MYLFKNNENLTFKNIIKYPVIHIHSNEFTFIAGKSGCGKSTLLKLLNRTLLPDTGSIYYNNQNINEFSILPYRKEVLLVPQDVFLIDGTIEENYKFYYNFREENCIDKEEMIYYLKLCLMDCKLDINCSILSGGERQRVFLAIFLSFNPKVLLLDEPTAALDQNTSIELLNNIKLHCSDNKISVICVCHSESVIGKISKNIIRLEVQ